MEIIKLLQNPFVILCLIILFVFIISIITNLSKFDISAIDEKTKEFISSNYTSAEQWFELSKQDQNLMVSLLHIHSSKIHLNVIQKLSTNNLVKKHMNLNIPSLEAKIQSQYNIIVEKIRQMYGINENILMLV